MYSVTGVKEYPVILFDLKLSCEESIMRMHDDLMELRSLTIKSDQWIGVYEIYYELVE